MYRISLSYRGRERLFRKEKLKEIDMLWTQFVIIIVILISIQYTLNKILVEMKRIRVEQFNDFDSKGRS